MTDYSEVTVKVTSMLMLMGTLVVSGMGTNLVCHIQPNSIRRLQMSD